MKHQIGPAVAGLEPTATKPDKTAGEKLEGVAFTFCKVATVALLAGRFVLPVAAGIAAVLYVAAYAKGKQDTRCVLQKPLLIAGFWSFIAIASLCLILVPGIFGPLAGRLTWWQR